MLDKVKAALTDTGIQYAHHAWNKRPGSEYCTYAEDAATHMMADNQMVAQVLEGTIDLFTKDDTGAKMQLVQEKLQLNGVPFYLNSVQYESDTGFLHYEWVFADG